MNDWKGVFIPASALSLFYAVLHIIENIVNEIQVDINFFPNKKMGE
jgi:hypothetical protein